MKPGYPPGYAPNALKIIEITSGNQTVTHRLTCAEFQIVQLNVGFTTSWLNVSQQPGSAFIFKASVNLRFDQIDNIEDVPADIREKVKEAVKNKSSSAFSIQQLLFDLNTAALMNAPEIDKIPPGSALKTAIDQTFLGIYYNTMRKTGQPMLHVQVVAKTPEQSPFRATDLNLSVGPYINGRNTPPNAEESNLSTLSYLCACFGDILKLPTPFTWNWLNADDAKQYHGILSINRDIFARYISKPIATSAKQACKTALVNVDIINPNYPAPDRPPVITASAVWGTTTSEPKSEITTSGPVVIKQTFLSVGEKSDTKKTDDGNFVTLSIKVTNTYSCTVSFIGTDIKIAQKQVINFDSEYYYAGHDAMDILTREREDVYALSIGDNSNLVLTRTAGPAKEEKVDFYYPVITDLKLDAVMAAMHNIEFTTGALTELPLGEMQNVIFPGGKVFAMSHVGFSEHQDLTMGIRYLTPE